MTGNWKKLLRQIYNPGLWITLFLGTLLLGGCSVRKFLDPGESLVKKNEIHIEDENLSSRAQRTLQTELKTRINLKPNSKIFFVVPSERRQLRIAKIPPNERDSSWFASFITKNFSEPPAFADSVRIDKIAKNLEAYLRAQGYFYAEVHLEIEPVSNARSTIVYKVTLGKLHTTNSISIQSPDSILLDYLKASNSSRAIENLPVSKGLYDREVGRITRTLRDSGYYEFYPSYVSRFRTYDTSTTDIDLELDIDTPNPGPLHRRYIVGDVYVYPDFDPLGEQSVSNSISYEDLVIQLTQDKSPVRPSILKRRIEITKGEPFNETQYNETIKQLGGLSIYRPPRISIVKQTESDSLLDYHIYLAKNKRYSSNFGLDLFYSTISATDQFGISVEGVFVNRNIFGGSEQLTFRISPGVEISRNLANTRYVTSSLEISTPRLYDWFGLFKLGTVLPSRKKPLVKPGRLSYIQRNANTRFGLSFAFYEYETFYKYNSLNLDYGVRYRRNDQRDFDVGITGINFWNPDKLERFDDIAQGNELFIRSFDKQLLTGVFFRDITFRYNAPVNKKGWSKGWIVYGEVSGLETFLATTVAETFGSEPILQQFILGKDTIAFSKFVKLELDRVFLKRLNENHNLAFRLTGGIIQPFGRTPTAPYNSKFFLGGPYSMRAWRVRELGPGGNNDTTAFENQIPFFQVGDLKFEANAEYRFKLFWLLEGALFVDVGNIWNLGAEAEKITQFRFDTFYKQIAIGAGFGVRLDFNYFIFRLDAGHRIKNNYINEQGTYWEVQRLNDLRWSKLNWNLGIGYPF